MLGGTSDAEIPTNESKEKQRIIWSAGVIQWGASKLKIQRRELITTYLCNVYWSVLKTGSRICMSVDEAIQYTALAFVWWTEAIALETTNPATMLIEFRFGNEEKAATSAMAAIEESNGIICA